MKQLFLVVISILFLFSCAKDKDEFIPIELSPVEKELRELLPINSSQYILNSNESSLITSQYNLQVELEANSFFESSESSNAPFEFNVVELSTYADYLSQNISHVSDSQVNSVLYSIYISANDNGELLNLIDNKKIDIRFPSELLNEEITIGKGFVENSELIWRYDNTSINESVKYETWTSKNEDGTITDYNGYQLSVDETGWYSIAISNDNPMTLSDICVDIISDNISIENSAVYFLSREHKLLSEAQVSDNEYSFCNYNLPISGAQIDVITISYDERVQTFYYSQETIAVEDLSENITTIPEQIGKEELKEILESL